MSPQSTEPEAKTIQLELPTRFAGSSAGEIYGAMVQEFLTLQKQSGGDRQQLIKSLLRRLQKDELITSQDVSQLEKVTDLVFAKSRGELGVNEFAIDIRPLNQGMLTDKHSSQIAVSLTSILAEISMMSVLRSAVRPEEGEQLAQDHSQIPPFGLGPVHEEVILEEALWGIAIGASLGGPLGGFVGGLLGSIVGTIAAALDAFA